MPLVRLQLRHGQRKADADPVVEAVDGRPMCSTCLTRHGDGWDVHGHPTLPWGRSQASNPRRKAFEYL